MQRTVADCPRFVSGGWFLLQGIPGGIVVEVMAPCPRFISGLCCRGSSEALLRRAVAYCPRFASGMQFVLQGLPRGVVVMSGG